MGGGHKFVRPGDITTIHGKNSAGKSPLLNLIAADHLAVDTDALWIAVDYELGRAKFRTRLFEQGFTVAMLDRIYYVEHPGLLTEQGGDVLVKNVLDYAEQRGLVPRLLTWDTYTRSASRLPNADPEKNATINAWGRRTRNNIVARERPSASAASTWPRGSEDSPPRKISA